MSLYVVVMVFNDPIHILLAVEPSKSYLTIILSMFFISFLFLMSHSVCNQLGEGWSKF